MARLVVDAEIYKNYFLVMFMDMATEKVRFFEMYDGQDLDVKGLTKVLLDHETVGFNSNGFDIPLINYALHGATCQQIKDKVSEIIIGKKRSWECGLEMMDGINHIDIIEVAPGQASLKIYGGRMHCPTMQDLPIDHDAAITPADRVILRDYCLNDLRLTKMLYQKLEPQIELRRKMGAEYGVDLRSKSDAQIAEVVIYQEVSKLRGDKLPKRFYPEKKKFKYVVPGFINFTSARMNDVLEFVRGCEFSLDEGGSPRCTALDDYMVAIGGTEFRMGIGGLHSNERSVAHRVDDDHLLIDRDVTSYYPNVIINNDLFPLHLGREFLTVYSNIVRGRVAAKHRVKELEAEIAAIELELRNED